jgi:O-methyltransferase
MNGASVSPFGKLLRRPWYALWRLVERSCYRDREYTLHVPFGHMAFTPWFRSEEDTSFGRMLEAVQKAGRLVVSRDRCYILYQWLHLALHGGGQVAERGVYTGGTAHLLAMVMAARGDGRELHLFDTFSGMPQTVLPRRDYHAPGDLADAQLENVKTRLSGFAFVRFHVGLTFEEIQEVREFAFVHVDIYPSVLDCCRWFWPRLRPGGVMLFDDYGFRAYRAAARRAVDEIFSAVEEAGLLILPTGQAVFTRVAIGANHG